MPATPSARSPDVRRPAAVAAALAAMLVLCAPAGAARAPTAAIGIGEQQAKMFTDPYFLALGIRHVRYVVAWDALDSSWQRNETDAWMAPARAERERVLLAFNVSRTRGRRDILPSVRRYRRVFRRFHRRYPFVRDFVSWNEANHGSQPTARRPDRVAAYYDVIAGRVPELRRRGRRRARREQDAGLRAGRAAARDAIARGSGACTTTSTPTASAPPGRARCCAPSPAASGSPRPAGSSGAATGRTRCRSARARRMPRGPYAGCSSSPR